MNGGGQLWVSHFFECDAQGGCGLAVDEGGGAFGFRSLRHDVFDAFTGCVNGAVVYVGVIVVG